MGQSEAVEINSSIVITPYSVRSAFAYSFFAKRNRFDVSFRVAFRGEVAWFIIH